MRCEQAAFFNVKNGASLWDVSTEQKHHSHIRIAAYHFSIAAYKYVHVHSYGDPNI